MFIHIVSMGYIENIVTFKISQTVVVEHAAGYRFGQFFQVLSKSWVPPTDFTGWPLMYLTPSAHQIFMYHSSLMNYSHGIDCASDTSDFSHSQNRYFTSN